MSDNPAPGPDAVVSLREITEETVVAIIRLSDTLQPPQNHMVASNAISIAQAHFSKHAWFRAIYADDTPVGFIMLYDSPEEKTYFLWRLMIAAPHQKKGYGRRAVGRLIDYVKTRPDATHLLVSCEEGEGSPEGFYRGLGFRRNGKMYGDEVGLVLPLVTVVPARATVDAALALRKDLTFPDHFRQPNAEKQGGEFDVSTYFSALTHLSMPSDEFLDYVYFFEGMGGEPVLYARPAAEPPYRTYADYKAARGPADLDRIRYGYLDSVQIDGTAEGFFEFVVLRIIGGQFYLFWHAGYNDYQIVCSRDELEQIIAGLDGGPTPLSDDVKAQVRAMDLEPRVECEGDSARVELVLFGHWSGIRRLAYTISREFPHRVLKEETLQEVPYNCVILF